MSEGYRMWKAPTDGLPEINSGGFYVIMNAGFGQWVQLGCAWLGGRWVNPSTKEPPVWPEGAIPMDQIVAFMAEKAG